MSGGVRGGAGDRSSYSIFERVFTDRADFHLINR